MSQIRPFICHHEKSELKKKKKITGEVAHVQQFVQLYYLSHAR